MTHFFISYKSEDKAFMRQVRHRLHDRGILTWTDEDIKPGEEWKLIIDIAIRDSAGVILIATQQALASQYVTYEWAYAKGLQQGNGLPLDAPEKPVITVLAAPGVEKILHPKLEGI